MSSGSSDEWKQKGNEHFAAGRYEEAINCYSKALEDHKKETSTSSRKAKAILHSNRSAAQYQLNRYDKSLADSLNACELDPTWPKAFWRQSVAHTALHKPREALRAIQRARSLLGLTADPVILADFASCWTIYVDSYFKFRTTNITVQVKWINETIGRGVFNSRHDGVDANLIIFRETPLLSHIRPGSRTACAHCMHTKLEANDLSPYFHNQWEFLYPNTEEHKWSHCEFCLNLPLAERYCSDTCKFQAMKRYHELLCVNSSWWVDSQKHLGEADRLPHPMAAINSLCVAQQPALINPLLITRMLAKMILHIASNKGSSQSIEEALEPYKLFWPGEQADPLHSSIVITCLRKLYHTKYQTIPELLKVLDSVITPDLYSELQGIISRNAQNLNPLSDFHLFLEGLPPIQQQLLSYHYNDDITPEQLVQTDWMKNLTVDGTGLFEIINSINHSCVPNAYVAMCNADHTASVVSKTKIPKGDEITISYIDETLPRDERRKKLKQFYGFDCMCPKCQEETSQTP